jgi:hypothetical protein
MSRDFIFEFKKKIRPCVNTRRIICTYQNGRTLSLVLPLDVCGHIKTFI